MHLMYTLDDAGNRIYTLKVGIAVSGMCHALIIAIENHSGRQSDKVCSSRYANLTRPSTMAILESQHTFF